MIYTARNFTRLLSDKGVLVIEDVQDIQWCDDITEEFKNHGKGYTRVIDHRHVKNRYDDIMIIFERYNK
jgi:hypothetical protein